MRWSITKKFRSRATIDSLASIRAPGVIPLVDIDRSSAMNWENDARIMFRKIDVNSDGALDQPELSSMLSDIGLLDGHIEQIFMQLDSDGDGQVARATSCAYNGLDSDACADIGGRVRDWIPIFSGAGGGSIGRKS